MDAKEVIEICLRKRVNWSLALSGSLHVTIMGCDISFSKKEFKPKDIITGHGIEIICECYLNDYSHRIRLRFDKFCEDYKQLEKAYNQAYKKAENRIK